MSASHAYITETASHVQQALGQMPIRSSAIARQMVKAHFPVPETISEIERYVHDLLGRDERRVCDVAAD